MTIYKITQTETHFGHADSLDDAQEQWNAGVYDCATSLTLDITEADFENPNLQLEVQETKICVDCGQDFGAGYHANEAVTITFATLKQAQNEAIVQGIKYAMDYLEDINYHDGANAVAEFLEMLTEPSFANVPTWQTEFMAQHALYSVKCEGEN